MKQNDNLAIGARGGAIAFSLKISSTAFGFMNQIILARILGAGGIGEVFLALSLVNISSRLARFGMEGTMMRFIPLYVENEENAKLRGTIYFVLKFCFLLSTVFVLLVWLFSEKISVDIFQSEGLLKLLPVAAVAIPASVIRGVTGGILKGYKDAFRALLPEFIVLPVLRIMIFLLLSIKGGNPQHAIIAFTAGEFLAVSLSVFYLTRKLKLIGHVGQKCESGKVLSVGFTMIFTGMINFLYNQSSLWILGIFMSTEAVGIYGVVSRLVNLIVFSLMAFSTIIPPILSSVYTTGDRDELKRVVSNSTRWILSMAMPIVLILVLEGEYILKYAYGENFTAGYLALVILSLGQLINTGSGLVGLLLQMTGKHKTYLKISLLGGVGSIAVNILLIPEFGIVGAAISTAICLSMVNIVSVFVAYKELSILTLARGLNFDIVFLLIITTIYYLFFLSRFHSGNHVLLAGALVVYTCKSLINDDWPYKLIFAKNRTD